MTAKKFKKAFMTAFVIFTAVALLGAIYAVCADRYVVLSTRKYILEKDEAAALGDFDCILVLGAGVHGETLSHMLEDRVKTAVELYSLGASGKLLMSGDHGSENYDEVNAMKSYAIGMGAVSSDVFMDHAGFSTYESAYRAKYVFNARRVLIVTQKYHLHRAIFVARFLGLDAYGADAQIQKYAADTNIYNAAREFLARNKDFLYVRFKPSPTYLGEVIDISGDGDITNDKA